MQSLETKMTRYFLNTGLLEHNRWPRGNPSFKVSDWLQRILDAGFDGIELWENHILQANTEERRQLAQWNHPIIFNQYDTCLPQDQEQRRVIDEVIQELGCVGMKWNGAFTNMELRDDCLSVAESWLQNYPPPFRSLCECHGRTVFEDILPFIKDTANWQYPPEVILQLPGNPEKPLPDLTQLFDLGRARITYIHLQMVEANAIDDCRSCLRDREKLVTERIHQLIHLGYQGDWCIKFTGGCSKGVNPPIETLFANACDDLKLVKEALKTAGTA